MALEVLDIISPVSDFLVPVPFPLVYPEDYSYQSLHYIAII